MIVYEFSDPVYGRPYCFLNCERSELDEWIRKHYPGAKMPPDIHEQTNGAQFSLVNESKNTRVDIIWIRWWSNDVADCGRLVHEVTHAALTVFKYIGADVKSENDEPFCYYLEYIFEQCLGALNASTRKGSRRRRRAARGNQTHRTRATRTVRV